MFSKFRRHVSTATLILPMLAASVSAAPLLAQAAHNGGVIHVSATRPASSGLPDSSAVTTNMIDAGRAVFHGVGTCWSCHGDHLQGGPIAPTLKSHPWRDAKDGALPNIYYVVSHGVPGTAMVAHPGGIADSLTILVASYVWAVSHGHAQP